MSDRVLSPALLRQLLGPVPQPENAPARILSETRGDGYVRYHLSYPVPAGSASCFVCVPEGLTDPVPAIFCHHQHARQFGIGKSEVCGLGGDPDLAYAAELAQRGFISIAPDAIGFEDRNWAGDRDVTWFELSTRLVRGRTLLAECLQEVTVAFDAVLGLFSTADRRRLGFIGHSYGGRMAMWAPAWDARISASVSNCGCIPYRLSYSHDTGVQAEFVVPGFALEFDVEDVLMAGAPCQFFIMATDQDRWSRGGHDLERRLAGRGAEHVVFEHRAGGHDFPFDARVRAYDYLSRILA